MKIKPQKTEICLNCGGLRHEHIWMDKCYLSKHIFNLYHVFDSKGESERYCRLRLKELTGKIKRLKIQIPFKLNGGKNKYTADFVYYDVVLGRDIIEDYKGGYQSDDFNKRWAWMKKQYPKYVYKISNFNDGREK